MKSKLGLTVGSLLALLPLAAASLPSQELRPEKIYYRGAAYHLYPKTLDTVPDMPSPLTTEHGAEILLAGLKNGSSALIDVTVENGAPLHYSGRVGSVIGKDQQLLVDKGDFPVLAETGLHSESNLDEKKQITGYDVSLITYIGRPGRFSGAGFMADDEDIISVLKGDNRLVKRLGLTHPQMAKPLFQVWNIILKEKELGNMRRYLESILYIFYNGKKVALKAQGSKGWQVSIFQDEVQGCFDIDVHRDVSEHELAFLDEKYPGLAPDQRSALTEKLSSIHFSEMLPYYVMRYGFYEGHTDYRADPIAISFVFGLKSIEEIEEAFPGELYGALTDHFTNGEVSE